MSSSSLGKLFEVRLDSTRMAGIAVVAGLLLSQLALLWPVLLSAAALCYWLAALVRRSGLSSRNARQALLLSVIGLLALAFSWYQDPSLSLAAIAKGNVTLVSMLVAVSFLSLVSRPGAAANAPRGKRSIAATGIGVHLFGAVINLSALFIVADKMVAKSPLNRAQLAVLTRSFSAAAFWSPFFAAMGVALTYAPDVQLVNLFPIGVALAVIAQLLTFFEARRLSRDQGFDGYPLEVASLWLPSLLAVLVFLGHWLWPKLSVLQIISLLAPAITLLLLLPAGRGKALKQHFEQRLPAMGNEIILFLSAGVFSFGLQALLSVNQGLQPFEVFNANTAAISYGFIMLLAVLGLHPVIGISIVGPLLLPLEPNHTMLGVVFLSSWALGSAAGPLSGMNIAIQGKYGIDSQQIMRWNLPYVLVMSFFVLAALYIMQALTF